MQKIKRIFTCKNGHSYESKEPIKSSFHQVMNFMLLGKDAIDLHCNDFCKICSAPIMSEDDYVNGKIVMGARRIWMIIKKTQGGKIKNGNW